MRISDLERFSVATLALAACESPADLCGTALAAMIALTDSDIHVFHTIGAQMLHFEANSIEIPPALLDTFNAHITEHPVFDMIDGAPKGGGGTRRWSDTISLRRFRQRALYHDFFRSMRICGQLASTFPVTGRVSIALAFNRCSADYTNDEVALVKAFVPHMKQLLLRMIGRQEVENALALREHAREAGAALVVDQAGKIWFANDTARKLLGEYFPEVGGGSVAAAGLDHLPARLQGFLRGRPTPDAALVIDHVTRQLVCTAGPLTRWQGAPVPEWMHTSLEPTWVRCVHLREQSEVQMATRLQGLGLTARESEVLRWLIEGKRNREIAQILGANPNTIRTHVQHVLEKLGVETRTAAASRASEFMRGT